MRTLNMIYHLSVLIHSTPQPFKHLSSSEDAKTQAHGCACVFEYISVDHNFLATPFFSPHLEHIHILTSLHSEEYANNEPTHQHERRNNHQEPLLGDPLSIYSYLREEHTRRLKYNTSL
jgi:hypothetical protein